ncbi:MAG: DNA primase [Cytophagaceae bacterium]
MKISQETLDRIQQSIEIADVIGDFVTLKKKGQYYMACCPFHNEKTPSFTVTPSKGIYKCFGCGKAGDAIQFVMDLEGLNYIEAMKFLGKKYGIEISEEEQSAEEVYQQNERDSLYIVLNYAKNYFHDILLHHEEGQSIGLSYFKERGFSDETIKKFELGYSLEEWDGLLKKAVKENYRQEILEKAGLIITRENANDSKSTRQYDRFRGRVTFPIHNLSGKVIAFGARILKNDKNQPKYLNSPETEVYHKSKILYGIFQAKNSIRQEENCYLVEGYTDVISLHQAGIENVVASSGTSLTEDQIKLISRFTTNITVLYDGDAAGMKASLRGTDMILEAGMNVSVVVFPDNEDPDSYVKRIGGNEFKKFIQSHKKDFITFKAEMFMKDAAGDPLKRAEAIREIVVSISKIPDSIKRSVFFQQCSSLLNIDEATLIAEHNKIKLAERNKKKDAPADLLPVPDDLILEEVEKKSTALDVAGLQEREIIRLLVNHGSEMIEEQKLADYLLEQTEEAEFQHEAYRKIIQVFREQKASGNTPQLDFFIRHEDAQVRQEVIALINIREISHNWKDKFDIYIAKPSDDPANLANISLLRFNYSQIQFMIRQNQKDLQKATEENDVEEQNKCLAIHMKLKELGKQIADSRGNVIS